MPRECKLDNMGRAVAERSIVFSANRKRIEFLNPLQKTVRKIDLDQENLPSTFGPRCDGIIVCNECLNQHEHYVELKGSHVNHAITQLTNSLQKLSFNPRTQSKSCYIICSRVPKTGTDIQNNRLTFSRNYNSQLTIKTHSMRVDLS